LETSIAECVDRSLNYNLASLIRLLDQLVEGPDVGKFSSFRLAFRLHRCRGVMEGSDLDVELVVELPQRLLFMDGIITVESRLLSITICLGLLLLPVLSCR